MLRICYPIALRNFQSPLVLAFHTSQPQPRPCGSSRGVLGDLGRRLERAGGAPRSSAQGDVGPPPGKLGGIHR